MSDADKWPKSFRWPGAYPAARDVVTFLHDDDTDRDLQGVEWTYRECASEHAGGISYWVPTDQHKQKSPPAPSQDGVKAEVAALVSKVRAMLAHHEENWPIKSPYPEMIGLLADAVERLAK